MKKTVCVMIAGSFALAVAGCAKDRGASKPQDEDASKPTPTSGAKVPAVQEPKLVTSDFGTTPDGQKAKLYTLTNAHGVVAKITDFGATLVELHVPDKDGKRADVVLGFDN